MKNTQAWGWLAAGVVALGLNGIYQDGGAAWAHRAVNEMTARIADRSEAVLALASGRADWFEAMSAREEAQFVRLEANRARIEAQVARVRFSPAFNTVEIPAICPRVQLRIPRAPAVRIPAPVVHLDMPGLGPV
jgi:hypothetical protein